MTSRASGPRGRRAQGISQARGRWLRRLLVLDQRPAKRSLVRLIESLPGLAPGDEAKADAEPETEIDRCLDQVMSRLAHLRVESRRPRSQLRTLLRNQLLAGNKSGAVDSLERHVPDETVNWPLLAPVGVFAMALVFLLISWRVHVADSFLLYGIAGLGLAAVLFVALAIMAARRFQRIYPHAEAAARALDQLEALLDAHRPELAREPYDRLRALAEQNPGESRVLRIYHMRAALELARHLGDDDVTDAERLLGDIEAGIEADTSESVLSVAILAVGELASTLARERPQEAERALAILRQLTARVPSQAWVYASAKRRVDSVR